jgi:hypothetical protein
MHYFYCSVGTSTDSTEKHVRTCYDELMFLHPVGSAGHVVYSSASGARNVNTIFFMLRWDWYGFHKKLLETRTMNFVFAFGGIYVSRCAFQCAWATKRQCTICHARVGPEPSPQEAHWDTIQQTCIFPSGGICGSRSVFRLCVWGAKHQITIFLAPVGLVQIPQKAR